MVRRGALRRRAEEAVDLGDLGGGQVGHERAPHELEEGGAEDDARRVALALEQLEQGVFVDRATRVIFVDLSAFNANVGMFYSARIVFEFLPSGGIVPSSVLRVLKPMLYEQAC